MLVRRSAMIAGAVLTTLMVNATDQIAARGYTYRYTGHPSSHYYTNVDGNRVHRPVLNNASRREPRHNVAMVHGASANTAAGRVRIMAVLRVGSQHKMEKRQSC
jgi:hypothetical protein